MEHLAAGLRPCAGAVHGRHRGFGGQAQPGLRHHVGLWGSAHSLWGGSCWLEAVDDRRSQPNVLSLSQLCPGLQKALGCLQ